MEPSKEAREAAEAAIAVEYWGEAGDPALIIQQYGDAREQAALDKGRADERARVAAEVGRLTEVLRDIAGNGDPDFPSYSQSVARSALAGTPKDTNRCGPDYWSVALIAAWLREQDGHGEWRDAADAIDAEFLCRDVG